eukprot:308532-Amphidinium_carterae.2
MDAGHQLRRNDKGGANPALESVHSFQNPSLKTLHSSERGVLSMRAAPGVPLLGPPHAQSTGAVRHEVPLWKKRQCCNSP